MKALIAGVNIALTASLAAWTMAADDINAVLQNSFVAKNQAPMDPVSYTHLRAHETS